MFYVECVCLPQNKLPFKGQVNKVISVVFLPCCSVGPLVFFFVVDHLLSPLCCCSMWIQHKEKHFPLRLLRLIYILKFALTSKHLNISDCFHPECRVWLWTAGTAAGRSVQARWGEMKTFGPCMTSACWWLRRREGFRALEYNIPSTGHKKFMSNTAPYVPQNKKWRRLGICLQSFIIAGGACKANWANLIFMVEPVATVVRNSFSLHRTPLYVLWFLFFTGNRTLIPYSLSLDIGLLVKINRGCQGFSQTTGTALSRGVPLLRLCFLFRLVWRCCPAVTVCYQALKCDWSGFKRR